MPGQNVMPMLTPCAHALKSSLTYCPLNYSPLYPQHLFYYVSFLPPYSGILPDLMVSRNLTGCTGSTGSQLEMDFKHAFSKLNLYVVKQNEEDDDIEQMEELKLLKVEIAGTRNSGTFDIVSGEWNYSSEDLVETRTYYANTDGLAVKVNPESIAPASEGASYIFPNSDGEEVSIVVTLSGMTDENGNQVTDDGQPDGVVVREFNVRLMNEDTGEDMGPFVFEQNHEYTLVVTVLKDDVRTVAISPQKYDWIDEEINVDNGDAYIGQPVTFANQMWMDRNLGAKSADCENDWWNCRGYYYQYGRNIPYLLDMDKYEMAIKSGAAEGGLNLMAFYTYNEKGEKVYGGFQAGSTTKLPTTEIPPGCAAHPGIVHQNKDIVFCIHLLHKVGQGRLVSNVELKAMALGPGIPACLTNVRKAFSRKSCQNGVYPSACQLQSNASPQPRTGSCNYCVF